MLCLRPLTWFNNEVIHFVMSALIKQNDTRPSGARNSHCFNSFFMQMLLVTDGGYVHANVNTWTRPLGCVQAFDLLFFPINISNSHWTLLVASVRGKTLYYLDSMSAVEPVISMRLKGGSRTKLASLVPPHQGHGLARLWWGLSSKMAPIVDSL
jgi:Ulp1 family protease